MAEIDLSSGFDHDWFPLDELPPLRVSTNANERRAQHRERRREQRREERKALDTDSKHWGECQSCGMWGRIENFQDVLCARCLPTLKAKIERRTT